MADTLVERVTGLPDAAAVPVEVQVVLTDATLLGASEEPGQLPGYGTVPSGWARELVHGPDRDTDGGGDGQVRDAQMWLRRLYTAPGTGELVAMDSTRRVFDGGLRRFLLARDGSCRTPWCDAPIRHLDHVVDHAAGGPTTATNGQGVCEHCNHTKQLPGWHVEPVPDPTDGSAHQVRWTTPVGNTYQSHAPPLLPGTTPPPSVEPDLEVEVSLLELHITHALAA